MAISPQQQQLSLRHNVPATVYVLHFDLAYKRARHYIGWTAGELTDRARGASAGPRLARACWRSVQVRQRTPPAGGANTLASVEPGSRPADACRGYGTRSCSTHSDGIQPLVLQAKILT